MPVELLERLWGNRGGDHRVHRLRDRALWRLAYDTAARVEELLNLNVEDIDLDDRSAPVVGKGGDVRRVRWHTGTNRLVRDLVGERTCGPLFLTERLPTSDVAAADLCPTTGLARLSYTRAWEIFRDAAGEPWTLHHLRHSRLTHLGEQGLNQHQLQAISGHRSARSLDQYVHVSDGAVKRLYDAIDPAARRRPPH